MKRIVRLIIPIICLFCLGTSVSAGEYDRYDFTYPNVVDDAGLLSNDEQLSAKLSEISEKYDLDVVVVTVYSLGGKTATEFADDFYDYNDYSNNGILFLLSMEYRDWAISTKGYGITAFTDYGWNYIFNQMKPSLANDKFERAFDIYAEQCEMFLEQANTGRPYDTNNRVPGDNYSGSGYSSSGGSSEQEELSEQTKKIIAFGGPLFVAFIAAIITVSVLKGQLTSVRFQKSADPYIDNKSTHVTQSSDIFLYKNITKTRRQSESSGGGGGGGGGSSTHVSSSGSTHGGGSGKF